MKNASLYCGWNFDEYWGLSRWFLALVVCIFKVKIFGNHCLTFYYARKQFGLCLVQEEHSWGSGSRGQGPGSPSPGEGASPGGRLERTPSFTAEWEEVRGAFSWHVQEFKLNCNIKGGLISSFTVTLHRFLLKISKPARFFKWSISAGGQWNPLHPQQWAASVFSSLWNPLRLLQCRRSPSANLTSSHIDFLL